MANGLVAAGARVTAVTASREVFLVRYGADEDLESAINDQIRLVRVPFFPEKAWPQLNDWSFKRAEQPSSYSAHNDPALAHFPEVVYAPWLSRVHSALIDLHHADPIDLLLATGSPYVDLQAASLVGSDFQIPTILDDRDAFVLDVFTGEHHDYYKQRLPFFVEWLAQCKEMWFVNPPIATKHQEAFPEYADKIKVVENGWDDGVVVPHKMSATPHQKLRAAYVGLLPTNFPFEDVFGAWIDAVGQATDIDDLQCIGPLGFEIGSPGWVRAEKAITAADRVAWFGHVPRQELATVYADLDVLMFVKAGGAMVTGGKTYEYLATGLPIVALVDQNSDALRVFEGYPRLHVADYHDREASVAAIRSAVADRRSGDEAALHAAQKFGAKLSRAHHLQPDLERIVAMVQR